MKTITLNAQKRSLIGRKVQKLRAQSFVPGVVYGHGFDNTPVSVLYSDFFKIFKQAGESTLVDLAIDSNKPVKVLIQDIQRDPVTDAVVHVDLRQVKLDEKVEAEVNLEFVGVSMAVKELGGILVHQLNSIHVKAFPQDLVYEIKVDLAPLKNIGDKIIVSDVVVPETFEILNEPQLVVATIEAQRVEEVDETSTTEAEQAILDERKAEDKESGEDDKSKNQEKKKEK